MKSFNDFIVDVKQLKINALNIKSNLDRNVKLCAIVKANAYGLGVETVCKTLYGIADFFAVSSLWEALNIRIFDKITPIVVLGMTDLENIQVASKNDISISVSSLEQLLKIEQYSAEFGCNSKLHLQVNSGLNRYGFKSLPLFKSALKVIESSNNLELEGVYSHFATKSNDVSFLKKQFVKFNQFKNVVKNENVIFHISNSYATSLDKKFHLNMVRNGFALYGGNSYFGNKFVLSIKSKLVNIFEVKKGDTIGYDRTFVVPKAMKIGVVPLGYADGYDRRLSNKFYVLAGGEKCRILGNICMDCFMIDLTNTDANVGDDVVILGKQKQRTITLQDIAEALQTSPYEVLLKFNYKRMNYITKN